MFKNNVHDIVGWRVLLKCYEDRRK